MKKTLFISVLVMFITMTTVNAKTSNFESNDFTTVKVNVDPFCMAIVKGDVATVKKMIQLGADVNKKSQGMTPVMYAARYNKAEILKLLIDNGAKLKVKSKSGHTALKYAELSNAKDAKKILENELNS